MRTVHALALLGLCLSLSGCGQDLLAGGHNGRVNGGVTDDAPASTRAPSRSLARAEGPSRQAAATLEGRVATTATLHLVSESGRVVAVAPAAATATVEIASGEVAALGTADVEAGRYVRARFAVERVEAEVTGGITLGGTPLPGSVRVQVAESVVVDAPIELTVEEGGEHAVVLDLNALAWLLLADPATRLVPAAAFLAAVEVRVEE